MARLLTIDSCTVTLRNALLGSLRSCDEAILLPQSHQSIESGAFKNVTFRLCGATGGVNPALFSHDWFSGVSLVRIRGCDVARVDALLEDPASRKALLERLKNRIQSQVADPDLQVGPQLESDELERDVEDSTWKAGFDAPNCFAGIFSAEHSKVPEGGKSGMARVHKDYFLVCRAGAGVAASTFHSRLVASLQKGLSLDQALESEDSKPGAQALRRLTAAGTRNRARILLDTAEEIGLIDIASVGDQAARNKHRGVVPDVDTITNTIRKLDDTPRPTWQYSACVDGALSKGVLTLSNQADGIVLFMTDGGDAKVLLKNEMWSCIPSTSKRTTAARSMVDTVVSNYTGPSAGEHPDASWISAHFSWKNRTFTDTQPEIEPFGLWGAYGGEQFVQSFARELGVANYKAVRLRPELVCSAGVDAGKLRAIVKAVAATPAAGAK